MLRHHRVIVLSLLAHAVAVSAGATSPCREEPDPTVWKPNGTRVTSAAAAPGRPIVLSDGTAGAELFWNDTRTYGGDSPVYTQYVESGWFYVSERHLVEQIDMDSPGLALAPERTFLAVWSDTRNGDGDVFVQRRAFGGGIWPSFIGGGIPVCTAPGRQTDPTVALDGQGGFYVAWVDERFGLLTKPDIYIQRFHDYGLVWEGWPVNGVPLTPSPGDQFDPVVVSDGAGGALVFFRDATDPYDMNLFMARISPDGVVPSGWANGKQMTLSTADAGAPIVFPDPAGGAYLAWQEITVRGANPEMGIRLTRVNGAGEARYGWPLEGKSVETVLGVNGPPTLAADVAGGVFIGWVDDPSHADPVARVSRFSGEGLLGSGWPAGGRVLGTTLEGITSVALLAEEGSVIAAWTAVEGSGDIRALRLDYRGSPAAFWPPEGVPISAAPGTQLLDAVRARDPASGPIVSDGAGGAIVFWSDSREGRAIYAQRISRNGVAPPREWFNPCNAKERWITRAYPVPTRGGMTLEVFAPNENPVRLEVYDVRGRLRHVSQVGALPGPAVLPLQLDLSSLEPGVYFVRYRAEGGQGYPRGSRRIVLTR